MRVLANVTTHCTVPNCEGGLCNIAGGQSYSRVFFDEFTRWRLCVAAQLPVGSRFEGLARDPRHVGPVGEVSICKCVMHAAKSIWAVTMYWETSLLKLGGSLDHLCSASVRGFKVRCLSTLLRDRHAVGSILDVLPNINLQDMQVFRRIG